MHCWKKENIMAVNRYEIKQYKLAKYSEFGYEVIVFHKLLEYQRWYIVHDYLKLTIALV